MAGWPPAGLAGKRILEVGPGDNLGVALLLAAAGARRVVCLDRFDVLRDERRNREVYRGLAGATTREFGDAERHLDASGALASPVIESRSGVAIEQAVALFPPGSFDVILSRAALEHVYDLDAAWRSMDELLAPGGVMLHKVDFRNHGLYDSLHPLLLPGGPGDAVAGGCRALTRP